ncbi:hypothetical protein PWY87_13165 [Kribbella solani]|nr:hypothetical protein [Kribbella solani]MDX3002630.1 hypothetical protein [Kribbella solani]
MTYRQRVAGPAGRAIPSAYTVTAYEPDSQLASEVTADLSGPTTAAV